MMRKIILSILFIWISSIAFSQITISVNQQNVTCFGLADGGATVTANGGTPAYSYTWLPGGQTTSNATNLTSGQYTVIVADASLATNSYTFNITEPAPLTVNTQVFLNCYNPCSNEALALVTGGTAPYTYAWSNGAVTQQTVGTLCTGNYSVQITDANGCVDTSLFNLNYNSITVAETHTNSTCSGLCNGAISFSVTGGSGHYSYNWLEFNIPWPGIAISSPNQYSLCTGAYTLTVTDSITGCVNSTTINISPIGNVTIPNLTVTAFSYNESCNLSGDGMIDLTLSGSNTGPFTYLWSNGATTQDVYNLTSGSYTIVIIDNNSNCKVLYDTISSVGINCGTISGNVFVDVNSDCVNNTGDYGFNNMPIIVNPGNRLGYTNTQGNYSVNNLPYGTYSVTLNPININISATCTTTITTSVSSPSPASVNNALPIVFNASTQPDMTVFCSSSGIVPGFSCSVGYGVQNLNPINNSGQLKVILPSIYIANLISASPNVYTISGDTIIWSFNNLAYYNYSPFSTYFYVPVNTPLGSPFVTCAYVETTVPDLNYANNTNCYNRLVTGSFDPNDKTVSPVGIGATGDIAPSVTDLTYLIRFQNTGNGPAVNIVVKDTLSPNLDINTFEMIHTSHNYNIEILPGNILRWKFNNIMLPDSNSNEPASHGYIQYRIKRTANNTPGTQIKNTAYIYFDFNEPVVTNTTLNTIETLTSIQSHRSTENGFDVYPNPSSSAIHIKIADGNITSKTYSIKIMDVLGKEILTTNYKEEINISNLEKGIYFLSVYQNKQLIGTKKVVKE